MKTAEQWVAEYGNLVATGSTDFVRQVQADALRHAAAVADKLASPVGTKTGGAITIAETKRREIKRRLTEQADQLEAK